MRVSHHWLQRYTDAKLLPERLAEGLSSLGLEVESYEDQAARYAKFVVGRVLEVQRHPNADRLTVCKVDVGKQVLQIVCGAPNVVAGQNVAVGLVGATVPRNQHDPEGKPFVLENATIRGVASSGMICSEYELNLGDDAEGILVLDRTSRVGIPLAKALGKTDVVYELEITANRGDWLGHFGVSREVGVLTGKPWKKPAIRVRECKERTAKHVSVKIHDPHSCARYSARLLRNVTIGPSPRWMQELLTSVGIRPINNIVDVTNFVLMETGHPIHAFDFDRLEGHAIVVRKAEAGEKFVTLDGKERILRNDTLMICDGRRPVAVAGVMGGANTEISEHTTAVLIESAWFDPVSIRRTSRYLGLSSEASQRFERSADIDMTVYAAERAAQLIQEFAGAEVLRGTVDAYPRKRKVLKLGVRVSRTNSILGTTLKKGAMAKYLGRLEFTCLSKNPDTLEVVVPSFRSDVREEIDLIEEIARVHGYDSIATTTTSRLNFRPGTQVSTLADEIRSHLHGAGFNEVIANSLQKGWVAELAGAKSVGVLNPVSLDMAHLRTSLIPGALEIVRQNLNQNRRDFRLFEIGKIYHRRGEDSEKTASYEEEECLLMLLSGMKEPARYGADHRPVDFFDLKGEVEALLGKFFLDKVRFVCYDSDRPLSAAGIDIEIQGTYAGYLGKVRREVAARFDIEQDVFCCELKLGAAASHWPTERRFKALPRFPGVTRDLAFVVDSGLPYSQLEEEIRKAGGALVSAVSLFDVFSGRQVGEGKKSLALTLVLQPLDHTLTDEEASQVIGRIVEAVGQSCGAELRAQDGGKAG